MTDKIESQGKTVEEAVNEALLRMGARKDEVQIEVLEEPKSGLFGILGGKRARVLVTRKKGGGRRGRNNRSSQPEDVGAHQLSDGESGTGKRGGRRGGRRSQPAARRDEGEGGSDRQRGNRRGRGRGSRGGQDGAAAREDKAPVQAKDGGRLDGGRQDGGRQGGGRQGGEGRDGEGRGRGSRAEGDGRSRRRRGGRSRRNEGRPEAGRPQDQETPDVVEAVVETSEESSQDRNDGRNDREQRRDEGGRGRSRRRGGRSRREQDNDRPASETAGDEREGRRGGRSRFRRNRDDRQEQPAEMAKPEAAETPEHDMTPDETILTGISAVKYAEPMRGVAEEDLDQALVDLTNGLLIRAGFPIRCEVKTGEYRQVRVTTDESSAGMLIGRHGATVDAIEHLVERMAGMAAGDRVRMNLDINNYRRRREESLHDRVNEAAGMVLENGRTYHMESMCARERRIVHLQVEKVEGLRTFTMGGAGGKHVVIALDNGERKDDDGEDRVAAADDALDNDTELQADEGGDSNGSFDDFDDFDDGPQPETNDLVVDDDDHRPLI